MQLEEKEPLTLDQLNDDCLECIFQRFSDLPTQLQAARTCQRFHNVITHIWQHTQLYRTFCLDEWRDRLEQHEDLKYFLAAMRDYLEVILIGDDCLSAFLKDLEDLEITYLPHVHKCVLQEFTDCYPSDEDIYTLTKLLPNLKYLLLTAPISGCHIAEFVYLEELHLYDDQTKEYEIKDKYLREICTNLKNLRVLDIRSYEISFLNLTHIAQCVKLEILKLNLNALKPVLNDVLNLPNLRRLTVLLDDVIDLSRITNVDTMDHKIYETDEFYKIISAKCACITGLAIDSYFMPLTPTWDSNLAIHKFTKLKKFAYCNCDFEAPAAADMLEKYTKMTQLQLLCLRDCSSLTNAIVLQFIVACPLLEHLDVSYCKLLNKSLLHDALSILQEQKRAPLYIYYHSSGLEHEVDHVNSLYWGTQKLLRFSNDFPPGSDRGLSYVQRGFEFDFE